MQAPLLFVRGGIATPGRVLSYAGYNGYYWSSVGTNSANAYDLYFNSGYVVPSGSNYRHFGFSVRCVALGG